MYELYNKFLQAHNFWKGLKLCPLILMLLRDVTEKEDWESWILYMLRGVEETALWTAGRIEAIRKLFDDTVSLLIEVLTQ